MDGEIIEPDMVAKVMAMKLDEIIELAMIAKEAIERKDWDEAGCRTDNIADELELINIGLSGVA